MDGKRPSTFMLRTAAAPRGEWGDFRDFNARLFIDCYAIPKLWWFYPFLILLL